MRPFQRVKKTRNLKLLLITLFDNSLNLNNLEFFTVES